MNKKYLLIPCGILSAIMISSFSAYSIFSESKYALTSSEENYQIVYSSAKPVIEGTSLTNSGNSISVKTDGVNWNDGSGKVAFAANGYIQNTKAIHGIKSISISLSSGSVDILYSYERPTVLETPMYFAKTIAGSETFNFNLEALPSFFRISAREETKINNIAVNYDCYTDKEDAGKELLAHGLENSWIDFGASGRYARTSYSLDTYSNSSKRSIRLDFSNTNNNYVSLSTQRNYEKYNEPLPDFSNTIFSLKAKFSEDIVNKGLKAKIIGKGWADLGFIPMTRSSVSENGWYTYTLDLTNVDFLGNNEIIRINVLPEGIDSTNKNTAYVLLDEIEYKYRDYGSSLDIEPLSYGLENLPLDEGQTNCDIYYDAATKFGRNSRNSVVLVPGKEGKSKNSQVKWNVCFMTNSETSTYVDNYCDYSKGVLSFDYKPINISSPTTVYLKGFIEDWSGKNVAVTDSSTLIRDGWYHFNYDLSRMNLVGTAIRLYIGFDVTDSNIGKSKIYLDNIRVNSDAKVREDYTLGLENMSRDTGWEKCNVSIDYANTATETSTNSYKLTFNGKASDVNKNFICFNPALENGNNGFKNSDYKCGEGILEAKFYFSNGFTNKDVRLVVVDENWKTTRYYNLKLTPLNDGWYLFKYDLSNVPNGHADTGFNANSMAIRFGFGFEYLNSTNKDDKAVWIDDVFWAKKNDITSYTSAKVWQAYDSENILRDSAPISGRNVTSYSPLKISSGIGGTDSTQLMIYPSSDISSYSVKMPNLYNENGDYLEPSNFEVLVEKYILCDGEKGVGSLERNIDGWMGVGYYPDALVPIDRIIKYNENTIAANQEQGIWINCNVPNYCAPGTYKGDVVLTLNNVDYNVPFEVTVYDFKMPEGNTNRNLFVLWDDQIEVGECQEGERTTSLLRSQYYDFLVDHGIQPDHNRNWEYVLEGKNEFDSFADEFANNIMPDNRITTYRLPDTNNVTYEYVYGYLEALVRRNIEEWDKGNKINFFDKIVSYMVDEPSAPEGSRNSSKLNIPSEWTKSKEIQKIFDDAVKAIVPSLANYPEIKAKFEDLRNIVTMNIPHYKITGGTDKQGSFIKYTYYYPNILNKEYVATPCPTFENFNTPEIRQYYANNFNHTWFYGCIWPTLPYPSYHTDTPLLGQRMIPWMQYQYDVEGSLYWGANFYQYSADGRYNDRDVWNNPNSGGNCLGDGQIVYPGQKYGIYGPISSIRLENIRASMEDYSILSLLDENINAYNFLYGTNYSSGKQIISSETSKMFNNTKLLTKSYLSSDGYRADNFDVYRNSLLEILANIAR